MSDSFLTIENLDVYYDRAQALDEVSLTIDEGEIVSVIGPNGAGKTTLLNAISNLHEYDGSIEFEGEQLTDLSPQEIVSRGIVHATERRDLFPFFSVQENLRMGAHLLDSEVRRDRFEYVYDLFPRLDERREQEAMTLSGGEQQMLAIGRALMSDPDLLMLDEPSQGLAPVIIEDISEAIDELNEAGLTILLTEQNFVFTMEHVSTDRLYLLEKGSIELTGTVAEFRENDYVQDAYVGIT